tara:strand:- start:2078 stop:2812 length:735 start_codon:yes stop_codon:yes gene_type:complete
MKIVATIEARMASSRLPGKVLMEVDGIPMLKYLIKRLKVVRSINEIVIATTINAADDALVEFAKKEGIQYYRGSEDDVMGRVINTAESVNADIVVEITGDCPIIDPQIVEQAIRIFLSNKADYVSNAHVRSYPDGMDTQVFKLETLKHSYSLTDKPLDREHVTLHIRNNPDIYTHLHLVAPPELHWPELGLTLDELNDYRLLVNIISHFSSSNPLFSCLDVIKLLRQNIKWLDINKSVIRKGDT